MGGSHKTIKIAAVILLAIFFAHQVYASVYRPITTKAAQYGEIVNGLNINAVIIRDEKIVNYSKEGVLHFNVEGGKRVEKNGIIASVYSGENDSVTAGKINELNARIADIEELQGYNAVSATDLDLIKTRLTQSLDALRLSCAYGSFEGAQEKADELMMILNRRQMVTDDSTDFSAQLTALKAQRDSLAAGLSAPKDSIRAQSSGYFIDSVDGYEKVLTVESLDTLTPEQMDSLAAEKVENGAVGKLVSDYKWYIAAVVKVGESLSYKEGESLTVSTSVKTNPSLSVTVEKINISKNSDRAVIIMSCQEMSSALAAMRTGAMTIVSGNFKGLRLPRKALRVVDNVTGVYILSGMELKFVPVNVLYNDGEEIICELENKTSGVLKLYDEVVVKGKNLYDGKVVG